MRSPDRKSTPIPEPLEGSYSFGDSKLIFTDAGITKAVELKDNFENASADEVFEVVRQRSRSSHSIQEKERVNLENFVHVELPEGLGGKFRYNPSFTCELHPDHEKQKIYVSRDSTYEKDGKTFILANTEISVPKGRLKNSEFPDHHTDFKNMPLILEKDTEINVLS